jgi:beta-lactamase regulating signal transducer with metallopeptidase domain
MATELFVLTLLKAELASSGAILLVLLLRLPARRLIGAELAYGLWAAAPAGALASLFPGLPEFVAPVDAVAGRILRPGSFFDGAPALAHAVLLARLWLAGAAGMALLYALAEARFRRQIHAGQAGPAVTGAWLRMIAPADFAERFTPAERALIREHERAHMDRRDPHANLLIAACVAVSWFNPLVHLAGALARLDQELACDARVVGRHPRRRREYAQTLLKAHLRGSGSPFACALSVGGRHPLEVRMAMLAKPSISVRRDRVGVVALGLLAVGVAMALWTLAPI